MSCVQGSVGLSGVRTETDHYVRQCGASRGLAGDLRDGWVGARKGGEEPGDPVGWFSSLPGPAGSRLWMERGWGSWPALGKPPLPCRCVLSQQWAIFSVREAGGQGRRGAGS